jgi:hypothetical protein
MTMRVLHLGRSDTRVLADARDHAQTIPDVELYTGSSREELRAVLARTPIDHVIIGGGLDLDTRLALVREIFERSDSTTVHMNSPAAGPQSGVPFLRAIVTALGTLG